MKTRCYVKFHLIPGNSKTLRLKTNEVDNDEHLRYT